MTMTGEGGGGRMNVANGDIEWIKAKLDRLEADQSRLRGAVAKLELKFIEARAWGAIIVAIAGFLGSFFAPVIRAHLFGGLK